MYTVRGVIYDADMLATAAFKPKAYSYLRMSTERQLLGDSKRRQEELSRRYAEENGLLLVEESELKDIGISAYNGRNVKKGALGAFLEQVDAGKIERGSYLLVESFDRLSRQDIIPSLSIFMRMTEAGINIVTLSDRQVYKSGETDIYQLMFSIMSMSRAHDESKTKSERISAAWANKRKNIGTEKLTARSVGWVKLSEDKKTFSLIPERVKIVRRIFEETANGIGAWSIVRRLNEEGIKPFGHASDWQKSSVDKIILNRAVIGEFQPKRRGGNGVEAAGEPVLDYYPAAVEEGLFYRAQAARADRTRNKSRGRRGIRISNLFSGLAVCGYCQARIHYLNKGSGPKGGAYLVCDAANRKVGCTVAVWRYEDFETSFLTFVEELDLEPLAQDGTNAARRSILDDEVQDLRGRRQELEGQRERAFNLGISSGSAAEFFAAKIETLSAEIDKAAAEIAAKTEERDLLQSEAGRFYESRDQIKQLIARLQSTEGEGIYELRAQVAARLQGIVASLQVFPAGEVPKLRRIIEEFNISADSPEVEDVAALFAAEMTDPASHVPYFLIMTKDGRLRKVTPSTVDPAMSRTQIVKDGFGMRIIAGDYQDEYYRPSATRLEKMQAERAGMFRCEGE